MLVNADEKVLGAGNLNKTLSLDILYKISSENRAKYDLDKEFVTFMIKLFNQQQKQIRGEEIHGYIQEFAIILLPVILFREKQIRCLASDKLRYLHLDAIGSIIAQLLSTASTI